jgi:2-hydroxy-6-oxonona-2,4-dienedioate hydrolase
VRRPTRPRLSRRSVTVGAHRLHLRTGGPATPTGPPVLLVPGLGMSGRYLSPTADALAEYRRVIVPDLPGVGRSPHPEAPLTPPELADLLHELLRATVDGPAVVVGNSFGSVVAVELALRHPGSVYRLVLTSPVVAPQVRNLASVLRRFLGAMCHEPVSYLAIAVTDTMRGWSVKGRANLRTLLDYPLEDRAATLTVPTVVVRGRSDRLVPAAFARRLAVRIPQAELAEVAAGHAMPYDAPHVLVRVVLGGPTSRPGRITGPAGPGSACPPRHSGPRTR